MGRTKYIPLSGSVDAAKTTQQASPTGTNLRLPRGYSTYASPSVATRQTRPKFGHLTVGQLHTVSLTIRLLVAESSHGFWDLPDWNNEVKVLGPGSRLRRRATEMRL
jgi:hypothetical protein